MKYEKIVPLSRVELKKLIESNIPINIFLALITASQFDDDIYWTTSLCLDYIEHQEDSVKIAAIIGLAHICRIHKKIVDNRAIDKLNGMLSIPTVSGYVKDALDDIKMCT